MKLKTIVLIAMLLFGSKLFSQENFLLNGGFEEFSQQKTIYYNGKVVLVDTALYYKMLYIVNNKRAYRSDIIADTVSIRSSCEVETKLVNVHSGNASVKLDCSIGNENNFFVAIQTKLARKLTKGNVYMLKAFLKSVDRCGYMSVKSCIFNFSDSTPYDKAFCFNKNTKVLLSTCDNRYIFSDWTPVFAKYKATGMETYLTIGVDWSLANSKLINCPENKLFNCANAYLYEYYIDDISITESSDTAAIRCEEKKGSNYTKDAVIILPNITFMSNSDSLKPSSLAELKTLLVEMRQNAALEIEISGHTDDVGIAEKNIKLSDARAKAVKRYLVKNGISEKRIQTKGMGYNKPLIRATDKESRAKNRRVEVKVLKN